MKRLHLFVFMAALALAFASCSAPQYLAVPKYVSCPIIENTCSFGIQNMDQKAKVENSNLVCHYKNFDVQYTLSDEFILSLTIINKSEKDLLIDKTKCFVMYNGNATQLFKDVRMTGSTTFNDVTGSTNISTNHGRVMMIIPSYSKWSPTLNETNLRATKVPALISQAGLHHLSVYDNPDVVEFSFEYSYDNKQAKWGSCRNKVYVNTVDVKHKNIQVQRSSKHKYYNPSCSQKIISPNEYISIVVSGRPDFSEFDRINAINQELYNRHNTQVKLAKIPLFIVLTPLTLGTIWLFPLGCDRHTPPW